MVEGDNVWEAFLDAKVVIWFCPDRRDENHPDKDSVNWETVDGKMVPECLICGRKGAAR